jgi:predicted dehydrogenase
MSQLFKRAGDIKVGVIGYGGAFNMGRHHLKEMQQAGMTPVAVAEIDPARLKTATADFPGIETWPSVAEMLRKSKVNLVVIITPHNTHARLALQCLRAGRHVVCEKPLAITTAECDAMIAEARRRRLVLSTYHNRHWEGAIVLARKLARKGVLGQVYRAEAHMGGWAKPRDWWRSSRSISGGALYDWGVHLLEYSLQVLDSEIDEVSGFAKRGFWGPQIRWKKDAIEDEGFATVRFKNGAWLTLCISALDSNPKRGRLELTGTKGTFLMLSNDEYELVTHDGDRTVVTKGKSGPSEWHRFYRNVARHLVRGEKLEITPEWSRRPIHILDLAARSAALGRALKAKYG